MLNKIKENGPIVGHISGNDNSTLKYISHIIETIRYDEMSNKVYGELRIIDTEYGRIIKEEFQKGTSIYATLVAYGTINERSIKLVELTTYNLRF